VRVVGRWWGSWAWSRDARNIGGLAKHEKDQM